MSIIYVLLLLHYGYNPLFYPHTCHSYPDLQLKHQSIRVDYICLIQIREKFCSHFLSQYKTMALFKDQSYLGSGLVNALPSQTFGASGHELEIRFQLYQNKIKIFDFIPRSVVDSLWRINTNTNNETTASIS